MLTPRAEFGIAALDGKIYAFGGTDAYKYDPEEAEDYLSGNGELMPGHASEPSTDGNEDKPYLLVTHNRVKGKGGIAEFNSYKGEARTLLIWDESLISSQTRGVCETLLKSRLQT